MFDKFLTRWKSQFISVARNSHYEQALISLRDRHVTVRDNHLPQGNATRDFHVLSRV